MKYEKINYIRKLDVIKTFCGFVFFNNVIFLPLIFDMHDKVLFLFIYCLSWLFGIACAALLIIIGILKIKLVAVTDCPSNSEKKSIVKSVLIIIILSEIALLVFLVIIGPMIKGFVEAIRGS